MSLTPYALRHSAAKDTVKPSARRCDVGLPVEYRIFRWFDKPFWQRHRYARAICRGLTLAVWNFVSGGVVTILIVLGMYRVFEMVVDLCLTCNLPCAHAVKKFLGV